MYLDFNEFENMGGMVNEDSYPRYELKARRQIQRATFGRLTDSTAAIPESVKNCMFELISAIAADDAAGGIAAGRIVTGMSNDGMSVSFANAKSETARYRGIIHAWLSFEVDACGIPLLYAGVNVP